jgi:hypothetical protein
MSIVHLPTCPQVRVCVREEATRATRYCVVECVRCHAELIWTPRMDKGWKKWRALDRIFAQLRRPVSRHDKIRGLSRQAELSPNLGDGRDQAAA